MYQIKSNSEIKDISISTGVVTGYASIFGVEDSDNDIIHQGAFSKTINERFKRIKHLYQHDSSNVIGRPVKLTEDNKGLYFETQFGSDTNSQDKLKMHKDGLLTELSIGFNVIKSDYTSTEDERRVRNIKEIKLWEYSSVTWGANSLTSIISAKGEVKKDDMICRINDRMNKLVKALRHGNYTDETFEQFEIELKQIQQLYNDLIVQVTNEPEDVKVTTQPEKSIEPVEKTEEEKKKELIIEFRKHLKL